MRETHRPISKTVSVAVHDPVLNPLNRTHLRLQLSPLSIQLSLRFLQCSLVLTQPLCWRHPFPEEHVLFERDQRVSPVQAEESSGWTHKNLHCGGSALELVSR
jgi:hypothetical protein